MGLLPEIAADLSPQLFASHPDAATAAAGGVVSGYALGVVVGMLLTPWVLRRMSERATLVTCASAMMLWTLLTALSPNLGVAIALRFVAALTHATYVGLASALVARRLGTSHHGRGAAIVVGGLSAANLIGVPILTAIGSGGEWRLVLAASALFFAVPVITLLLQRGVPKASTHAQSALPVSGPMRGVGFIIVVVVAIASGCFAVTTFVAPISAWAQGSHVTVALSVLMLLFGIGMNVGNICGGWFADHSADRTVVLSAGVSALGALLVLMPLPSGIGVSVGMLLVGFGLGALTPSAQVLYTRFMGPTSRLGASLAPGTINFGSFAGALLGAGALAIAGPASVAVVALALALIGGGLQIARRIIQPGSKGVSSGPLTGS